MVKIVVTALHVLLSIALIAAVILQSGRSAGLSGAIAGGAETLFGKKKGLDELLGKVTIVVAVFYAATALFLAVWK
ncbi:MAG: preprotein translocase subunit SecG [Firmicutes bacterium]|nr:preprotein translocase subunit SecG [Bacillota bacterium]